MTKTKLVCSVGTVALLLTLGAALVAAQVSGAVAAPAARFGKRQIGPQHQVLGGLPRSHPDTELGPTFGFGLIDFPRSPDSTAFGVNSKNEIVGIYGPNLPQWEGLSQSYLLKGNDYLTITYPGAPYTNAFGINKQGEIVGWYLDPSGNGAWHAFLRKGTIYSTIDFPGAQYSAATNINNAGEVIGIYYNAVGAIHGFTFAKGVYTSIDPPGSTYTSPFGINSTGVVVGQYEDAEFVTHGFTYYKGQYTTVDYPGSSNTALAGINDQGQMVGEYGDDVEVAGQDWPTPHTFLFDNGVYTPFTAPVSDAQVTWVYTLNGDNFVGFYIDSLGNMNGYEATITP
jgi:uncharacterized membrane protein